MAEKKTVKLGDTFLPKYKRVLVQHPQRVLNKPKKKKKKITAKRVLDNPRKKNKKLAKPVHDLLDSQSSITCFWGKDKKNYVASDDNLLDSQCSLRATCSDSEKKVATPVDYLLDSQLSLGNFMDSQGRIINSQPRTVCMHACFIA